MPRSFLAPLDETAASGTGSAAMQRGHEAGTGILISFAGQSALFLTPTDFCCVPVVCPLVLLGDICSFSFLGPQIFSWQTLFVI
jgi:hypothetical protein